MCVGDRKWQLVISGAMRLSLVGVLCGEVGVDWHAGRDEGQLVVVSSPHPHQAEGFSAAGSQCLCPLTQFSGQQASVIKSRACILLGAPPHSPETRDIHTWTKGLTEASVQTVENVGKCSVHIWCRE